MTKLILLATIFLTLSTAVSTDTNTINGVFSVDNVLTPETSWLSDWISRYCTNCGGWLG